MTSDGACDVFAPIYLEEPDIATLSRPAKVQIASHNMTWETLCR